MLIIKDSGDQLAMLTEFEPQPRFRGFQRNLTMLNAALFAVELTERFLEDHDPHPDLFDKFQKFLETLQETDAEFKILAWLILYQLRLLEEIGLSPMLDACVNCSGDINQNRVGTVNPTVYFSSSHNGLLCSNCEMTFAEKRVIDTSMLDTLQNPTRLPKAKMQQLKDIEGLLIYHFTELLHKPPRMAKYFIS